MNTDLKKGYLILPYKRPDLRSAYLCRQSLSDGSQLGAVFGGEVQNALGGVR